MSKDSLFYVADMLDAIEQLETALTDIKFAQYEKEWVLNRVTERSGLI